MIANFPPLNSKSRKNFAFLWTPAFDGDHEFISGSYQRNSRDQVSPSTSQETQYCLFASGVQGNSFPIEMHVKTLKVALTVSISHGS